MKRIVISAIVGGVLAPVSAMAGVVTLNDGWMFGAAGNEASETVNLPHTWNGDAYSVKDYLRGKYIYRRPLSLKSGDAERRHYLRLEGASKSSRVLVNGHDAGSHKGGYTESVYLLSPFLRYDGSDMIEIEVENESEDIPPVSGDFTFFGGIYRDVWLEDYAPVHFSVAPMARPGITVVSGVKNGKGSVHAVLDITNENNTRGDVRLTVGVYDPSGRLVGTESRKMRLAPGADASAEFDFRALDGVSLWSPDSPSLYSVVATVADSKGRELDRRTASTGFRTFGFDDRGRFILNGNPLKLRGVCRHQDMKPIGPALSDEMHRRDMQIAKEMGANFIRIAHYPQDPAILEAADRLGLLVWEEIPVIDFVPDDPEYADNAETAVREMITRHRNHPSVVMWGYMNEILLKARNGKSDREYDRVLDRTRDLAARLDKVCREMDPDRLTAMAFHGSHDYVKHGMSRFADVNGWNLYQGWYGGDLTGFEKFLNKAHAEEPGKPIIISEYGAGSDRRLHSRRPAPFDFSMEYQQKYLEHYLPVIEDSVYVAGAAHWNLIDFGSAKREESMPRINNKGILYADRTPKDVYYLFKASWRDDCDVVYIASRDYDKRVAVTDSDTPLIPVKIYANTPEVTLCVNGGERIVSPVVNRMAEFMVPVRAGYNTLVAEGGDARDVFGVSVAIVPEHITADNAEGLELAVNVGSDCDYVSPLSGMTWVADREYVAGSWGRVGGKNKNTTAEIEGTDDLPLFQSMAEDMESYRFDVPDGTYEVEVGFADPSGKSAGLAYMLGRDNARTEGRNSFLLKVGAEGEEREYCPSDAAGPRFASRIKTFTVAKDGHLDVTLKPVSGHTMMNSIKIRKI